MSLSMDMMNSGANHPQQTFQGRPPIQRQDSTSSTDSSHSSQHTRPRKAIRSANRRSSPAADPAAEDDQTGTGSRRQSSSSMRTSSAPLEGPVTYTPTTHRISKAKKGKRVHACQFPGCNKVFTRAEHRRRHELNHSPEASYPCDRAGCRKAFHRQDLLQRHQDRHELEAQTGPPALGHRGLPTDHSNTSIGHPMLSSTAITSPPMLPAQAASNGLSIPSLLHPQSNDGHGHGQHGSAFGFVPRTPFHMYSSSISGTDDFIYSSPESSNSPLSDHYGFPHRGSISSSSSSVADFVPPHCASPLIHNAASGWAPLLPPSALPASCNSLEDEMGGFDSKYQIRGQLPVCDLQTAFLLEILAKYRSRKAEVGLSPRFRTLFASLNHTGSSHYISTNPFAVFKSLPALQRSKAEAEVRQSRSFWLNRETRRRLLLACLVLEGQLGLLFGERRGVLVLKWPHHGNGDCPERYGERVLEHVSKLPLPCSSEMWECEDLTQWAELAGLEVVRQQQQQHHHHHHQQFGRNLDKAVATVGAAADAISRDHDLDHDDWADSNVALDLDMFRSNILITYATLAVDGCSSSALCQPSKTGDTAATSFYQRLLQLITVQQNRHQRRLADRTHIRHRQVLEFTTYLYTALQHTPIHDLLLVIGDSWVFGRKVEREDDFIRAQRQIASWLRSRKASVALDSAWKVIRLGVGEEGRGTRQDLNLLHEYWALYIAAVICWVCAAGESSLSLSASQRQSSSTGPEPGSDSDQFGRVDNDDETGLTCRRKKRNERENRRAGAGRKSKTNCSSSSSSPSSKQQHEQQRNKAGRNRDLRQVLQEVRKKLSSYAVSAEPIAITVTTNTSSRDNDTTPTPTPTPAPAAGLGGSDSSDQRIVLGGLLDEAAGVLSRLIESVGSD